eukprot:scaffold3998_cov101-Isochrysis_galbana.AAC.1
MTSLRWPARRLRILPRLRAAAGSRHGQRDDAAPAGDHQHLGPLHADARQLGARSGCAARVRGCPWCGPAPAPGAAPSVWCPATCQRLSGSAPSPRPRVLLMRCRRLVCTGEQVGRRVELATSFEMKMTVGPGGVVSADLTYLRDRLEQYKKTFPRFDMLGWYSTAGAVLEGDMALHQQLCELNESLLYLALDPAPLLCGGGGTGELPIALFESEVAV